jgi:hypothetical protein
MTSQPTPRSSKLSNPDNNHKLRVYVACHCTMASVAAPEPVYTLPPSTTLYRSGTGVLRVQDLCLSYLNIRYCVIDPLPEDLTFISRVRISESRGHHGGSAGTWRICQVESGPTLAAFEPTDGMYTEISHEFWPADLHPNTDNRREIEIFRQDITVAHLDRDNKDGTETSFFVRWRNLETSLGKRNPMDVEEKSWDTARLFTPLDAFSIMWQLHRERLDLIPLHAPLPGPPLRYHLADISQTEYYQTTAGSKTQPTMVNVMRASHSSDRTFIGSLGRAIILYRLQ